VFFFFQAEDGIRDLIVTGVQTCALPICASCCWNGSTPIGLTGSRACRNSMTSPPNRTRQRRWPPPYASDSPGSLGRSARWLEARLEERRVGEESRGRWGGAPG